MKSPSLYPIWYDEYEAQIDKYAEEHNLLYINVMEHIDEIGVDWTSDTYDAGLHVNVFGVEKVTDYIGKILQEEYNLTDHRDEAALSKVWEDKCAVYEQRKADLLEAEKKKSEVNIKTNRHFCLIKCIIKVFCNIGIKVGV